MSIRIRSGRGFFFTIATLVKLGSQGASIAIDYLLRNGPRKTAKHIIDVVKLIARQGIVPTALLPIEKKSTRSLLDGATVLLVSGDPNSPSHSYRVENFIGAFVELGEKPIWVSISELKVLDSIPSSIKVLLFWRTNISMDELSCLTSIPKADRPLLVYDTDDLTFDQDVYTLENVHGLTAVSEKERDFLTNVLPKQQELQITQCDLATATTEMMEKAFKKLGKETIRVPIVIPAWMNAQAKHILSSDPKKLLDSLKIVYASGTNSHGADFRSAWSALIGFLKSNVKVSLTILGDSPISDSDIPEAVREQIIFLPKVPHEKLLETLAEFNLQIAPLEIGNPFVEAKSATKFMQAGLLGIPTIASSSQPFRDVISHGVNGWLAGNEGDWRDALETCLDLDKLHGVGQAAQLAVSENHLQKNVLSQCQELLNLTARIALELERARGPYKRRIVWVLPNLPVGSGGHRNILRFVNALEDDNYSSIVYVHEDYRSPQELQSFVKEHYGYSAISFVNDPHALRQADVLFATFNTTVGIVKEFSKRGSKLCYLVQDFEPYFYPMGSDYLAALNSYFDPSLQIICSGPWMSSKILEMTGKEVPHFGFPVDRGVYFLEKEQARSGVLFFAKADTPRRVFSLGVSALQILRNWDSSVEISLFGGDQQSLARYKNIFNVLGRLKQIDELGDLYRGARVGLSFSTTNPSLIPYEMMACGLPVVDVKIATDQFPKYGLEGAAALAAPDPFQLARKLRQVLDEGPTFQALQAEGLRLVSTMPTEVQATSIMKNFVDGLFQ